MTEEKRAAWKAALSVLIKDVQDELHLLKVSDAPGAEPWAKVVNDRIHVAQLLSHLREARSSI